MTSIQTDKLSSLAMPWPTDWTTLFGADRPLILEIGFGRGAFLFHLAEQNPDSNVIGLEISNQCLVKVENALLRRQAANIRVIHSRAETALRHLFQPAKISQVHINFPDPWFKSDHAHRRLMQRDTLDAIVSRLLPDGDLYLATDIVDYAEMSAALLADTPGLENQFDTPWVTSMPGRVTTKYEATALEEGRTCHYFHYRRNRLPALDLPVIEDFAMPHMVFSSPLSLEAMRERFTEFYHNADDFHVGYNSVYLGNHMLLFEIHVSEPTISQHTTLLLTERKSPAGQYTLKLGNIGHPRPTEGVHMAVNALGRWLVTLHPDAEILEQSVRESPSQRAR